MLTRAILLILSSLSLQAVCWNAGGPTILKQNGVSVECFEDQLFSGGTKFVDLTMGVGVFQTLRYGNFSYTIPAAPGLYTVTLDLVEPNKTGSGQRLFYVAVNGVRTANLDLWQLAGGANKQPYILKLYGVSNGQLKIEFVTVLWNAVVSAIHVEQMKPLDIVYGSEVSQEVFLLWHRALETPGPLCFRLLLDDQLRPRLQSSDRRECLFEADWWAKVYPPGFDGVPGPK